MLEARFQNEVRRELVDLLPGCFILKNDSESVNGVPDLLVLYGNKWAMLEVKADRFAPHRPNQDYYISKFDEMSFAAFVFPENKDAIFGELRRFFRPRKLRAVKVV